MKSELVCLVIVGLVLHEALSSPLPQFSLTEEEFRSFPDEESPPNKVDIVSGYAKVQQQSNYNKEVYRPCKPCHFRSDDKEGIIAGGRYLFRDH